MCFSVKWLTTSVLSLVATGPLPGSEGPSFSLKYKLNYVSILARAQSLEISPGTEMRVLGLQRSCLPGPVVFLKVVTFLASSPTPGSPPGVEKAGSPSPHVLEKLPVNRRDVSSRTGRPRSWWTERASPRPTGEESGDAAWHCVVTCLAATAHHGRVLSGPTVL